MKQISMFNKVSKHTFMFSTRSLSCFKSHLRWSYHPSFLLSNKARLQKQPGPQPVPQQTAITLYQCAVLVHTENEYTALY